jgi:hypothetical protein
MHLARRPDCLFDGKDVQLLHFPGNGQADYRLVSFDIMHARANGRDAFASRFSIKNGVELFGIVPKYPCWYPLEEMAQVCAQIAAQPGPPGLAYGSSMGGYGALRYGRLAGCAAVLAFSPQAHIAPGVTGRSDPRYARFHDPVAHAQMTVLPAHLPARTVVVHDPRSAHDAFQVGLLPPAQITSIAVPHLGHRSVSTIASSAAAHAAFAATLAGDVAAIETLIRQRKKTAASYLAGLAQAAHARGHDQWAHDIGARAMALFPNDKDAQLVTAQSLGRLGQPDRAVAILDRMIAGYPHVLKYRMALVQVWATARRYDAAVDTLRMALGQQDRFDLHVRLIRLLRLDHKWAEARLHLRDTALKWPDRQADLDKLAIRTAA